MKKLAFAVLVTSLALPNIAHAGPAAVALSHCLEDNTSGKDRKLLVKWFYESISAHPSLADLSNISASERTGSNKEMAALVMRLMTQDCVNEMRDAWKSEGAAGFQEGFKFLGELSMRDLMTDPSVMANMGAYSTFIDEQKLNEVIGQQK